MTIEELISEICQQLGIKQPNIEMVKQLNTSTQLAAADPDKQTIYLKQPDKNTNSFDVVFAVVHELRHFWQKQNGWKLSEHIPSGEADVETYNLQEAEIDAHAYAAIVMTDAFGVKPLFNGLSEDVKSKIAERISEIIG